MKIFVDGDACPVVIKEILYKAAIRTKTQLVLIANNFVSTPKSNVIQFIQVASGFDVADDEIVKRVSPDDLVITGDIPLAAQVIEKGAHALNPRGELYSTDSIRAKLNMRDFMDTLRASGVQTGGPPPLNLSDRQAFANHLDRFLNQQKSQ